VVKPAKEEVAWQIAQSALRIELLKNCLDDREQEKK
jgi:hypothetical protein